MHNPFRRLTLAVVGCCVLAVVPLLAVSASDDFNRADTYPTTCGLGANWTCMGVDVNNSVVGISIFSGTAVGGTAGGNTAFWNAASFSNDQYSSITISLHNEEGPAVRASGTAGAGTASLYVARAYGGFGWQIYKKVNNGAWAALAQDIGGGSAVFAAGDVMRLEVSGTTLTLKKNGTTLTGGTVTDSDIASGSPGIWVTDNAARIADWTGGDLSAGGGATSRNFLLLGIGQ